MLFTKRRTPHTNTCKLSVTQHTNTLTAYPYQCVDVLSCADRPDGVNNGKITVYGIRARVFIYWKNCTTISYWIHTGNVTSYIRPCIYSHTLCVEIQLHTKISHRVSHLTCVFRIFCRIRLAIMDFQFQYSKLLIPSKAIHQVQAIGLVCCT